MDRQQNQEQEVEALHQRASGHYLQGDFRQALIQWQQLLQLDPADERALEGVRLCQMLCEDAPPSATQPVKIHELAEPMDATLEELDQLLDGAVGSRGLAEVPQAPRGAAPAAAGELRRRVNDLLAEALLSYEAGQREEAMASLTRVLILDEENEAAVDLLKRIRAEEAAAPTAPAATAPAAPAEDLLGEMPAAEPHAEATPVVPVAAKPAAAPLPTPTPEVAVPVRATRSRPSAGARGARRPGIGSRPLLAGALVLVLGGAGFAAWKMLAGHEAPAAEPSPTPGAARAARQAPAAAAAATPSTSPATTPEVPAKPTASLEEVLRRAETALAENRYEQAVLAYNEALAIDPQNEAVRRQMLEAGKLFKEARAKDERWESALSAFREGNFREALKQWYRVPAAEGRANIESYKQNGWYNLGVQALKSNSCTEAADAFRDAMALGPDDRAVARGVELARQCRTRQDAPYFAAVQELELRGLDD